MRIDLTWPGGEHPFALPLGGLRAVQDACDAGPMEILVALRTGRWRVDMPLAVLRHGLIGGGMTEAEARALMHRVTEAHPIGEFVAPAALVIAAAVLGVADDPLGEPVGAETPQPDGSASAGGSAPSTEAAPRPASPPEMSTP